MGFTVKPQQARLCIKGHRTQMCRQRRDSAAELANLEDTPPAEARLEWGGLRLEGSRPGSGQYKFKAVGF